MHQKSYSEVRGAIETAVMAYNEAWDANKIHANMQKAYDRVIHAIHEARIKHNFKTAELVFDTKWKGDFPAIKAVKLEQHVKEELQFRFGE